MNKKLNKFLLIYGMNFLLSIILIILKICKVIDISVWICLIPIVLITSIIGVLMLIITIALLKEKKQNGN